MVVSEYQIVLIGFDSQSDLLSLEHFVEVKLGLNPIFYLLTLQIVYTVECHLRSFKCQVMGLAVLFHNTAMEFFLIVSIPMCTSFILST